MISNTELATLAGKTMRGTSGEKIGKIVDVYESTATDSPTFVTVSTGLFGTSSSFVPLTDASLQGDDVVVPLRQGWSRTPRASPPTRSSPPTRRSGCTGTTSSAAEPRRLRP